MIIINETRNVSISKNTKVADTFFKTQFVLMNKDDFEQEMDAFLIPLRPFIIHTFFIKFSIDIISINNDNVIVDILSNVPPRKFSKVLPETRLLVYLPANTTMITGTCIGDKISIL